jgi:D-cysteine desulfhydrase family pyridoxal phosphate-dependent enzyme
LLIKRDDLTGLALGGNKARKLEYLLADAKLQGADTLLTCGAAQSNHALQTAAIAGRYGFKVCCVLDGPEPAESHGNMQLQRILKTRIRWCEMEENERRRETARRRVLHEEAEAVRASGGVPYVIPTGGSTPVGSLGYLQAAQELRDQLREQCLADPAAIYVASGSGGTQAGLEVGLRRSHLTSHLVGADVDYIAPDATGIRPFHRAVCNLTRQTAVLCGEEPIDDNDIDLCSDYAGPAYGAPTPEGAEAAHLLATCQGIFLDPVYTAKAFAAMIGHIRAGRYASNQTILFWHTGGAAGIFASH